METVTIVLSGRLNIDYDITKELKLSVNSSVSRGVNNRVDAAWSGGLGQAMSTALPIYPIMLNDSTYFETGSNPVRTRDLKQWRNVENRAIFGFTALYKLTDK